MHRRAAVALGAADDLHQLDDPVGPLAQRVGLQQRLLGRRVERRDLGDAVDQRGIVQPRHRHPVDRIAQRIGKAARFLLQRGALDRKEFELYYQPVVTAEDGTLNGFEALIRWTNQKLGSVSPGRFIPLAEDSRLIGPIGEWVLRTACAEAMRWPSNLKIAINVSAEQLTDPNFASVVVSALAQSGLPPQRLEIEVTESVFLRDGGGAAQLLDQLIGLGVRLSLDDFGTGYSSLGYLRKTQFSTIKVDRSFVVGAAKGSIESIAIIRAVVALADSLGMSTTAEGAETEVEVDTLRTLGCSNIQGYYYGRPMPATDVLTLFRPPESIATAAA